MDSQTGRVRPRSKRTSAFSDTPAQPYTTGKKPSDGSPVDRVCACGCGESFKAWRKDQKYLGDHRVKARKTHACPICGGIHIVKKVN